jgi:hypothetical protein
MRLWEIACDVMGDPARRDMHCTQCQRLQRVAKGEEVAAAIDSAKASGATALTVLGSPILWANRYLILDRVAELHLPAIYQSPEIAETRPSLGREAGGRSPGFICLCDAGRKQRESKT